MAQKTVVTLVDDLDGTPIEDGRGETIKFALDGVEFEIDLNEDNATKFRRQFTDYVTAGRQIGGARRRTLSSSAKSNKNELGKIREWANANGYNASARGRISGAIVEAYRAANN